MSYFKVLALTFIFLNLTISFVAFSSVENYFYNANLNNKKANQKEVFFSLSIESPGLFGSSSEKMHMKATMVISRTDKVRFLVEKFADSSYADDKFEGVFISDGLSESEPKDRALLGVLSYAFFGRSLEVFNTFHVEFLDKKTQEDLSTSVMSELVQNSTEKRLFNKALDHDFNENNVDAEKMMVGRYLFNSHSDAGISFDKIKEDKIKGVYFSKVVKEGQIGEMVLSFNKSDHMLAGLRLPNHEIKINTLEIVNQYYPKEILFLTSEKKSLLTFNSVKSYRRKRVNIDKLYSQKMQLNDSRLNFSELIW